MRGEVITLDLETTGLDPQVDEIIEVGIALCVDDTILATYKTFVKPEYEIPSNVTALTSISNEDVKDAPTIDEVLSAIVEFIGERPIMGHNIDFDLSMLTRYGICRTNARIDTYELASVLLPTADRYSLSSLVEHFGLTLENAHRALDDAIAAWQVYRQLWDLAFKLPLNITEEILEQAAHLDWQAKPTLQSALEIRRESGEVAAARATFDHLYHPYDPTTSPPQLEAKEFPDEIDVHEMSEMIEPGGSLANKLADYEQRNGQLAMLQMVGTAFNRDRHLMVEAPTGTGKALAYLLPAIRWSVNNQMRVVIATHSRTMQAQLLNQEIPFLKEALEVPLEAVQIQGRYQYLCLRRLRMLRRRQATSIEELRVLAKVLVWLNQDGNGERGELNLRGHVENQIWQRFSAQEGNCQTHTCEALFEGACPFFKAQRKAESAHLILVRDSLLFADINSEDPVIPPYEYLILDEAHHLEHAITRSLIARVDKLSILRKLAEFGGLESGILGDLLQQLEGTISEKRYQKIHDYVAIIAEAIEKTNRPVRRLFDELPGAVSEPDPNGLENAFNTTRITPQVRQHARWERVQNDWATLKDYLETLALSMQRLASGLDSMNLQDEEQRDQLDSLINGITSASTYLEQTRNRLEEAIMTPTSYTIYWLESQPDNEQISLNSAPLHVGKMVTDHLWELKNSVVLVSPTLRVTDTFEFIDDRLSAAEHVDHAHVETSIDYKKSALVYLPNDIKEPNQRSEYQAALEQGIIDLAIASEGRMLCLFTSMGQLRETIQNISEKLEAVGITILDETTSSNRQRLVEDFKSTEKAVLFGGANFWEDVDIPGDDLRVVALSKMPFEVPSNPIYAARSETYGDDNFLTFSLPDAVLRFRQGFERLIRRKGDRGVVVVFDRRMISKRYGRHFLESLPEVTLERGTLARMKYVVKEWLTKK